MSQNDELVSVILPTYNTPDSFLKESVRSILSQTYTNIELIIVDDGSTIKSEYLKSINDDRVILIENSTNLGLVKSLNKGIKQAKGKYIFRMDADDISLPKRIEQSVKYLDKNNQIDILGSNIKYFGNKRGKSHFVCDDKNIKANLLFFNPLAHPTIVFRKETIDKYNLLYSSNYLSEDYDLWVRILIKHKYITFHNYPKVLLKYRIHNSQITSAKKNQLYESGLKLQKSILDQLSISLSDIEYDIFYKYSNNFLLNPGEISVLITMIRIILDLNKLVKLFDINSLFKSFMHKSLKQIIIFTIKYHSITSSFAMIKLTLLLRKLR